MHRHENKLHLGHLGFEFPGSVESIEAGHSNIQHYNVRQQSAGGIYKRSSVTHGAHNFATGFQNFL
jgi:hypothetical protein